MRRRKHGQVDLEHGAECVMMTMQRPQQFRRRLRELLLAGLELPDSGDIAAR